ncbi:MAG: hypothetical protein M1827_003520 [Pycnora praestabilis]|nr:MAG: hypothetical protein M1827_003520 [Pycnora praestabilis]
MFALIEYLLLPPASRPVTLRTELARCFIGSFLENLPALFLRAPLGLRDDEYRKVNIGGVQAVMVPPDVLLNADTFNTFPAPLVLLFAHGGGFVLGEPLMQIPTYKRWIKAANDHGLALVIVSVDYRLCDKHKFPACRDDFLAAYRGLIQDNGIPPQNIVFGGDSAGGGLVAMSALHARKSELMPGGMVMISPWLDLTLEKTLNSPALLTDFMLGFNDHIRTVDLLLPAHIKPNDPQASPILDDLHSLPPQVVFAGTAEILLPDSDTWVKRSREAGNEVKYIRGKGEMHT